MKSPYIWIKGIKLKRNSRQRTYDLLKATEKLEHLPKNQHCKTSCCIWVSVWVEIISIVLASALILPSELRSTVLAWNFLFLPSLWSFHQNLREIDYTNKNEKGKTDSLFSIRQDLFYLHDRRNRWQKTSPNWKQTCVFLSKLVNLVLTYTWCKLKQQNNAQLNIHCVALRANWCAVNQCDPLFVAFRRLVKSSLNSDIGSLRSYSWRWAK